MQHTHTFITGTWKTGPGQKLICNAFLCHKNMVHNVGAQLLSKKLLVVDVITLIFFAKIEQKNQKRLFPIDLKVEKVLFLKETLLYSLAHLKTYHFEEI